MCDHPCWLWSFDYSGPFGTVSILSPGNLVQEVPAPLAQSVHPTFLHTTGAECRPNSGLPGLPVLAFLIRNVFVATFVPKMAAGGSPEVTLVSIYWATSSQSGQRERRQRHSEMHRKHIEYKRTSNWWGEAEVLLTQQLPLPAVWQGGRPSVGKEGPSECDGLDISPLNACSQYNNPAKEGVLVIIHHNVL